MNTSTNLLTPAAITGLNNSDFFANQDVAVQNLYERLCRKEASIALVGLGYVGLPLALEFAKDFNVIGFDINPSRVSMMKRGIDPSDELDHSAFRDKSIKFTTEEAELANAQFIIVAVPTPVDANKEPNLSPVSKACHTIGANLKKGDVVVFESTVYPGCTEEVCIPILEKVSGLRYNIDFKVGYSPERINPGDKKHSLTKIKKIVSGSDQESATEIAKIYDHIIEAGVFLAPSMKVAEAAKIVENTQRDVNIALMNELSILFEQLGIDTFDVLEAAGTKWNFLHFYPGLVGGHCIGVDPYYLIHKAKKHNLELPVISSSRMINDGMSQQVVNLVEHELEKMGKSLAMSKVLVLGTTFKENITDLRNSKAAEMAQILKEKVWELNLVDPMADAYEMSKYYNLDLTKSIGENYDVVIYAVNHDIFSFIDWPFMDEIIKDKTVVFDFKRLLNTPSNLEKTVKYLSL